MENFMYLCEKWSDNLFRGPKYYKGNFAFAIFLPKENVEGWKISENPSKASFLVSPMGSFPQSVFRCCATEAFLYFQILDSGASFFLGKYIPRRGRSRPMQIKVQVSALCICIFQWYSPSEAWYKYIKSVVNFKYRTRLECSWSE